MPSHTRELTVLGLLGATLWLPHCSQLTKVDWNLISSQAGSTSGGASGTAGASAGAAGETSEAGEGGMGGSAGEAGASGESGAGGEGDVMDNGGGGASAGLGGGGSSGSAGSGGTLGGTGGGSGAAGSAGAIINHPTCETAPATPTAPADLTGKIIFFDGGKGSTGARGGRAGLDSACATAKTTLQLPGSQAHAVISVAPDDEILTMPTKYQLPPKTKPVVSPLGIQIAASWNALWSTAISPSLVCAGVMSVGTRTWLTGTGKDKQTGFDPLDPISTAYGLYAGTPGAENQTCEGWTLGGFSNAVQAQVGSTIANNDNTLGSPPWFIVRFVKSCDVASDNILCAAYDP